MHPREGRADAMAGVTVGRVEVRQLGRNIVQQRDQALLQRLFENIAKFGLAERAAADLAQLAQVGDEVDDAVDDAAAVECDRGRLRQRIDDVADVLGQAVVLQLLGRARHPGERTADVGRDLEHQLGIILGRYRRREQFEQRNAVANHAEEHLLLAHQRLRINFGCGLRRLGRRCGRRRSLCRFRRRGCCSRCGRSWCRRRRCGRSRRRRAGRCGLVGGLQFVGQPGRQFAVGTFGDCLLAQQLDRIQRAQQQVDARLVQPGHAVAHQAEQVFCAVRDLFQRGQFHHPAQALERMEGTEQAGQFLCVQQRAVGLDQQRLDGLDMLFGLDRVLRPNGFNEVG